MPVTGDVCRQLRIGTQHCQFFPQLRDVFVEHHVDHVLEAQGLVFGVALIERQQHAAAGHGLEVLDHILAHAHIGTDEKTDAVEGRAVFLTGFGTCHHQRLNLRQLIEQSLAATVGHAVGAADERQLDVSLAPLFRWRGLQQRLVVALGHEHRVEAFRAQTLGDHMAGADDPRPWQAAIVRTELAGVLAGNVVLVGVVLEDHQVGDRTNEPDLADFLLEAQEEDNAVIAGHVDFTTEVGAQVALLVTAQPAGIALAVRGHAVVQAIQNGALFFLHQKQNFHDFPFHKCQNNSCRRTALRKNSFSP